jgi:hypothetical protein
MITERKIDSLGRSRPVMTDRIATAANLVINHGVDEQTAMELAAGRPVSKRTVDGFKDKVRKYALTVPSLVKKARNRVRDTIDMVPLVTNSGEEVYPSHTNALAAASMVLDRDQPVVNRSVNLNISTAIDPVDMEKYIG